MNIYKEKAKKLKDILGMDSYPVGVKFFREAEKMEQSLGEDFDNDSKLRYCQALMKARYGEQVVLNKENITCPASAAAFGFKPLAEKLKNGDMLYMMGLFASKEAASHTMDMIPRLELGYYQTIALAPLAEWNQEVDVVVVESDTEHIMWLALASYFDEGGRLSFDSAIFQATCVDSTIVPFKNKEVNTSLGCFGCREATNMKSGEALIGIPVAKLDKVVTNLQILSENAIPRSRSKKVYQNLI